MAGFVAGAGDEVVVRVRLDGSVAKQELTGIEEKTKRTFGTLAKVSTGALALFYGGIARQAASEIAAYGDLIGRATPIGKVASQFYAQMGAQRTAAERTAEAFGLAGRAASEEQIVALFQQFKWIEELRAASREKVLRTVGEEITTEGLLTVIKDATYAVKNIGEVLKQLGAQFKLR